MLGVNPYAGRHERLEHIVYICADESSRCWAVCVPRSSTKYFGKHFKRTPWNVNIPKQARHVPAGSAAAHRRLDTTSMVEDMQGVNDVFTRLQVYAVRHIPTRYTVMCRMIAIVFEYHDSASHEKQFVP